MIRFRLKELIAEKEFQESRRITLEEVAKSTGIHRTTLSKVSNQKGYNTTTEVLDKLCEFFGVELGGLAEHIKEDSESGAAHD
ncbi:helix-turn-helix domain-containing protein [Zhongshania aquimaris]|uniref:Helix-turn-helix transcriptional regulator n=1 Tax=Zhongshania aquimaris TaxID=2857107 RepID=A0ABS6VN97_9GAMM|nr:helix-turn-helix transcriptional regulator [Zhongshania aquimaris]MBW2939795.1 helix-turn-helix transcriptional regulator [Zhongshania aquimaris]